MHRIATGLIVLLIAAGSAPVHGQEQPAEAAGQQEAGAQLGEFMRGIGITADSVDSPEALGFVGTVVAGTIAGVSTVCLTEADKCPVPIETVQAWISWVSCFVPRTVRLPTDEGDVTVRADQVISVSASGDITEVELPTRILRITKAESEVFRLLGPCWGS